VSRLSGEPQPRSASPERVAICVILLLAFGLRVLGLWVANLTDDEAFFVQIAHQGTYLQAMRIDEPHPPLYLFLLQLWMHPAGVSEFAVRMLSVIPGVLAVGAVCRLGRTLAGPPLGLTAGLLAAINPYQILYSETARDYAQALFFGLLSFIVLLKAFRRHRLIPFYVLLVLAALYSHYYAIAIVALEQVMLLAWLMGWDWQPAARVRRWPNAVGQRLTTWRPWIAADAVIALVFLPWVAIVSGALLGYHRGHGTWEIISLGLRETYQWFNFGPAFTPGPLVTAEGAIVGVLFLAGGVGLLRLAGKTAAGISLAYVLAPLAFGLATLAHQTQFGARFLLLGAPGYSLILAGAVLLLWRAAAIVGLIAVAFFALLSGTYIHNRLFTDAFVTEAYRPLADYLASHIAPNDAVVLDGVSQWYLYWYYAQLRHGLSQRVEFVPPEGVPVDPARTKGQIDALAANSSGIWFIDTDALRYDPHLDTERTLAAERFQAFAHNFIFQRLQFYGLTASGPPQPASAHVGSLDLVDSSQPDRPVPAGGSLDMALRWHAAGGPFPNFKTSLRIEDANHGVIASFDGSPLGGFFDPATWPSGQDLEDRRGVVVPVGTPPGEYSVTVVAYDPANGKPLGDPATIAHVTVDHSLPQSAQATDLPRLDVRVDSERLVGAAIGQPTVAVGDPVELRLLWQGSRSTTDSMVPIAIGNQVQDHVVGGASYPTSKWQSNDVVADRVKIRAPSTLAPGRYAVKVGPATIGSIQLLKGSHVFTPPQVEHPMQAQFGDLAQLVGYDDVRTPQGLGLRLYWKVLTETDRSYKVFIHALDASGRIAGQVDLAANTERWVKNEFITDSYDLAVPSGALGKVEIGLYDEASGKRLPLCQAGTCGQADSLLLESA